MYISELQNEGFLSLDIKNPIDESEMNGCVWYYWDEGHKQYIFEYDSECELVETEPTINIVYNESLINTNGWAKENVAVTLVGNGEIKYCIDGEECEPNKVVNGNYTQFISTEGANYLCAIASNSLGTTDKKCININLDKTLPTIDGVGDTTIDRNEEIDLVSGVFYSDGLSGIDGDLTITPSTIDTSIVGTKRVTYRVVDKAGNVREVVRNVIVDADAPTIVFNLVDSSAINSNGWAKSDFYIRATITDNSGTGIQSGSSCTTNSSSECDPVASFTGTIKDFLISIEGSNRACIEVTDNNNKTTKVCSNTYNLDKTAPTVGTAKFSGTLGSNSWYTSNVTVSTANGSDALSGHSNTTSNISNITSNTAGTTITITTTDLAGNSSSRNYTIKVDKNAPTLTAKSGTVEITEGDNNAVSNYFTVSYSISGGSINCTPTNTSVLSAGTQTLSCTARGGNGLTSTTTKMINVKPRIYTDGSGANMPELLDNMIPIRYDGTNWIYTDLSDSWYDYDEKEWANAVILNSGVNKSVGQMISESEIALWYVWIPRYKYQLFNANNGSVSQQLINVTFESGTASTGIVSCTDAVSGSGSSSQTCTNASNGNWYTHPAFTFGSEQLTGFWVGKFEVSGSTSQITIKPGVQSLRSTNVSNFFNAIQGISVDYDISNGNSHMMKNMEWGAVAYLKQSKYGLGTTDITINSSYYTGGGSSNISYKSNTGQSTTGNVYGIYDMSGNSKELTMGNMVDSSGAFYSSGARFSSVPEDKYYDKYTYNGNSYTSHGRGKLGDATKETLSNFGSTSGGWYSDHAHIVHRGASWFARGGECTNGSDAGVFSFHYSDGSGYNGTYSTRAIFTP